MKPILLLAALAAISFVARANDSSFEGVGGSLRPTKGENKAIRMSREQVTLTANRDDFSTRAEFVFQNDTGQRQTVQMGFPETNFGDIPEESTGTGGFEDFATWVDGRKTPAKRTILAKADAEGFDTYWIKTVRFAPRQTRRVRVEFRSPYGGSTYWGMTRVLSYNFTGANWRGDVGQSVLEVRVKTPGLWRGVGFGEKDKTLAFSLNSKPKEAVFRRVWKNWPAQEFVTFGLERATPFWKVDVSADSNSLTVKAARASQTVRVGAKPKGFEPIDGFPTNAFTHEGVVYLSVAHLAGRLDLWGEELKPKTKTSSRFDARTGYNLRAGATTLGVRQGDKSVLINGKTVPLPAPVLLVPQQREGALFVPMMPVVKALGLRVEFDGERMFRLERGAWNGR